jgi:trimethylamine--corrinoid protein Co-methyltransferase
VISWLRRYLRHFDLGEDSLALDVIHQVGPDGHFLETDHTLRHVREGWSPALFDRRTHYRWSEDGALTLQERANRRVKQVIQDHRPEPLSPGIIKAFDQMG